MSNQLMPLTGIARFEGSISKANDRRRIELCTTIKQIFQELENESRYVIEITLNQTKLFDRVKELIEVERIIPGLIFFVRK